MSKMIEAKLKTTFQDLNLLENVLQELGIKYIRTNLDQIQNMSFYEASRAQINQNYNLLHVHNGNTIVLTDYIRSYITSDGKIHYDDMSNTYKLKNDLQKTQQLYTLKDIVKKLKTKQVDKQYDVNYEQTSDGSYVLKLYRKKETNQNRNKKRLKLFRS